MFFFKMGHFHKCQDSSFYAISTTAISTADTFNRLQFPQPQAQRLRLSSNQLNTATKCNWNQSLVNEIF